jgi:hypothetical protein
MERLQEEERPNVKIPDEQQKYPYNDWLALETEAEAASVAHIVMVLQTRHWSYVLLYIMIVLRVRCGVAECRWSAFRRRSGQT